MKTAKNENMFVTSNPHITDSMNTPKIMSLVILALLPSLIASIYIFGFRALMLALVCVISAVFFEWAFEKITKKPNTAGDMSAVLTGLLIAMNVPVTLPYWQGVIGSFVAIVIVKQFFGGLGQNFANPAITARIVLFVSFATDMTTWADPTKGRVFSASDAVTSATPLGVFTEGGAAEAEAAFSLKQLFFGTVGGSMGEVCALALLIGGLFLIVMKIIPFSTPAAFLGTVAVVSLIAGVDPLWQICAGGVSAGSFLYGYRLRDDAFHHDRQNYLRRRLRTDHHDHTAFRRLSGRRIFLHSPDEYSDASDRQFLRKETLRKSG